MTKAMRCICVVITLILLGALLLEAQEKSAQVGKRIVLHAAKLLDVKTGAMLFDQGIVIEGDKIVSVGPAASVGVASGGERIELAGATVLPGLIDCHTHLTVNPNLFGPRGLHTSYPRAR